MASAVSCWPTLVGGAGRAQRIEELLAGTEVQMPPAHGTFKEAPKVKEEGEQIELGL